MKQIEHEHQCALIQWARLNEARYPGLDMLFAIPNGGKRNISVAKKLKAEGVAAGIPDLLLACPCWQYHGMFIEMKAPKGQAPKLSQRQWHKALERHDYYVIVAYGWEAARDEIIKYLEGKI